MPGWCAEIKPTCSIGLANHQQRTMNEPMKSTNNTPKIGMLVTVRGVQCRIVKVLPMGTIDVVSLDGDHAWRVTGLPF
jgi:hypothetical protein